MKEERVTRAVELFKSGYNCSQSVVAAFADLYGYTEEQALKMASSFGGGIGRMRETCGAACGLFMLAGLQTGATDPKDKEGKAANYKLVQDLAAIFKERNHGNDKTKYQTFQPKLSKGVIDKIDILLGDLFGFSEEEKEYIINYDIKYRMGNETEEDED